MENPSLAFVGLDVETRAKDSVAKALSKMKEVRFVSANVAIGFLVIRNLLTSVVMLD